MEPDNGIELVLQNSQALLGRIFLVGVNAAVEDTGNSLSWLFFNEAISRDGGSRVNAEYNHNILE